MPNADGTATADELADLAERARQQTLPTLSLTGDPATDALLAGSAARAQAAQAPRPAPMPVPGDVVGQALAANGLDPNAGLSPTPSATPPNPAVGRPYAPVPATAWGGTPTPAQPAGPPTLPSFYDQAGGGQASGTPNAQGTGLRLAFPQLSLANTKANVKAQQEALAGVGEAESAKLLGMADQVREGVQQIKSLADYQATERSDFLKRWTDLETEIKEGKVDPSRLWNSLDGYQKSGALIGILFSGIGQGLMKGGPNMALQVIDKAIERDIAAQTAELGKKQNLLSNMVGKYGSLRDGQQAAYLVLANSVKMEAEARMHELEAPEAQAKAKLMMKQIESALSQKTDELTNSVAMQKYSYDMYAQMSGGGGGGGSVIPGRVRMPMFSPLDPASREKVGAWQNSHGVEGPVQGTTVYVDEKDAATVRNRIAGIKGLENTVREMESLAKNGVLAPGEKSATYQRLRTTASGEYARMIGAQPGGEAMKEFESMFPGAWENWYGSNRINAVNQSIYAQKLAIYGSYAGVDPKFIPVPTTGVP